MKKLFKLAVLLCLITVMLIPGMALAAEPEDYEHMTSGYTSKSQIDQGNAYWSLSVTPSCASSYGYLFNGATGFVYCGVIADNVWQDSDAYMSNSLAVLGDGNYAEIWFHDVVA